MGFQFAEFMIGILVGIVAFFIFSLIFIPEINITQETGDDICKQLTGNQTAVATIGEDSGEYGKLICELPSFDATQNIIIKRNSEE